MGFLRVKSKRFALVVLLLVFLAVTVVAFAPSRTQAAEICASGTVKSTYSAIRSDASKNSKLVKWLSSGTKLTITKEKFTSRSNPSLTNRWFYAKNYGGYMRSDLVGITYGSKSAKTNVSVQLRAGAGTGFQSYGVVSKGTSISVLIDAYSVSNEHWYRVSVHGKTGYMRADLVTMGASTSTTTSSSATTVAKPTTSQTTTPSTSTTTSSSAAYTNVKPLATLKNVGSTGTILRNGTILRASCSTLSSYLTGLNANTKLTITQEKFVSKNSNAASNIWVYASNYGGYVRSDLVARTEGNASAVTTDALNFRRGAGTDFASITVLPKNSKLTVLCGAVAENGTAWYRVKSGNTIGYVSAGYISFTSTAVATTPSTGSGSSTTTTTTTTTKNAITKDYLNFRTGAGTNYSIICTISKGMTVTVTGNPVKVGNTNWYPVTFNGKNGYLSGDYLNFNTTTSSGSSSSTSGNTASSGTGTTPSTGGTTTPATSYPSYITKAGFPDSYLTKLAQIHAQHPNWVFTPVMTGVTWNAAYAKMISNKNVNLIYRTYAPAYKLTDQGSYNYLTDTYVGKDSVFFVSASDEAVGYFMDPRNFLDDTNIFMFASNQFSSYHDVSMIQTILKGNSVLSTKENAQLFIDAGRYYNISAVYLATKAYQEVGSGTSQVNGKYAGYYGYYNVFNIGAYDSANGGSVNAMKYAKKMGWTSLRAAIFGGASTLRTGYIANNQATAYTEHFNVQNGYSAIGTHMYMTAVYAPQSAASTIAQNYKNNGLINKKLEFFIPVYNSMPATAYAKPSTSTNVDNNCYLKDLKVTCNGSTTNLITSSSLNYTTNFTVHVPKSATTANIAGTKASKTSTVTITGTGNKTLSQTSQKFTVTVKTGTNKTRNYNITIVRDK